MTREDTVKKAGENARERGCNYTFVGNILFATGTTNNYFLFPKGTRPEADGKQKTLRAAQSIDCLQCRPSDLQCLAVLRGNQ